MKRYLGCFLFLLVIWCCSDEQELEPSAEPEFTYTLPQGDHDYDAVIVDYYKRYECYFLYDYALEHADWNVNQSLTLLAMKKIILPDENQVGKLIDLLDRKFLSYYPDTLLRRTLPLRVFLAGEIKAAYWEENFMTLMGYRSLIVAGASDVEYTSAYVNKFKKSIQEEYINNFLGKNVVISEEFKQVSAPYYGIDFGYSVSYESGFLSRGAPGNVQTDWIDFLRLAATQTREYITSVYLNDSRDPRGLIRKKYEIALEYMLKSYQVDLEFIGNDVEQ